MHTYDVSVKVLIGTEEKANELRSKLFQIDPAATLVGKSSLLNHYFDGGNLEALAESVAHRCLSEEKCIQFDDIAKRARTFSVRTRQKDTGVYLVIKASVDDLTGGSGITHVELDEKVALPLAALDALILGSGFLYQSKWSREREEYTFRDLTVYLDSSAGYGWLAEFRKEVGEEADIAAARTEIYGILQECGVDELPQDRLDRMAAYYREHWETYYGTKEVFTVL